MTNFMEYRNWYVLQRDVEVFERATKKGKLPYVLTDYQRHHFDASRKYITNFQNAIDAGCNYGFVTNQLCRYFEKVFCFELVKDVYDAFNMNMAKHKNTNYEAFNIALGNKEGHVGFENGVSSFGNHVANEGTIEMKTIDSFQIENVGYLKVDVEGYEPYVIKGALETIRNSKPIMAIENKNLEDRYNINESVLDILSPLGYREIERLDKDNILIGVMEKK